MGSTLVRARLKPAWGLLGAIMGAIRGQDRLSKKLILRHLGVGLEPCWACVAPAWPTCQTWLKMMLKMVLKMMLKMVLKMVLKMMLKMLLKMLLKMVLKLC